MAQDFTPTMLVTGATDGIGRETARELGRRGARVLVHGRNAQKVRSVVDEVKQAGAPAAEGLVADFARLEDVRRLADEVRRRTSRLDVLVNNAGVFMKNRQLTTDGFETTWQVNHLAPFLLTNLLLDVLERSAPARVVNVSSMAHARGQIDWSNLNGEAGFSGYGAYALSKLANILFTVELARRVDPTKITTNALHPGVIATKLLREGFGSFGGGDTEQGAETSVYLATSPEVAQVTGRYFSNAREASASPDAMDPKAARRLWEESARMVGLAG